MKKLFIIVLMLVYGLSSSGAVLHFHYCCGKLDDITFAPKAKETCAKDEGLSKKRCCDNKHLHFKIKGDQEPVAKWMHTFVNNVSQPLVHDLFNHSFYYTQKIPVNELATGPPQVISVPIFIKNRVFRI